MVGQSLPAGLAGYVANMSESTGQAEYPSVHRPTMRGGDGGGGGGIPSAGGCICGGGEHSNQPDNEGWRVSYIVLLQTVLVLWHLRYSHFSAVTDMALIFRIGCPRASLFLRVFKWLELNVPITFSQMYLWVLWLWLYPKIWMLWRPNCRCNDLSCQLSIALTLD